MLESMMHDLMPNRAEATDIFNAVLDGTDAAMLSGETAMGKHPVASVRAMSSIIEEAESYHQVSRSSVIKDAFRDSSFELATTQAACRAAEVADARGVAALTRSGRTALFMSKLSLPPRIPFYALTAEPETYNRMALYYGVIPRMMSKRFEPKTGVWEVVDNALLGTHKLKKGDTVVIASGYRTGPGATNVCKIVKLGEHEYY
jgi:pyruvate kinase